jgi:hypothetical protein
VECVCMRAFFTTRLVIHWLVMIVAGPSKQEPGSFISALASKCRTANEGREGRQLSCALLFEALCRRHQTKRAAASIRCIKFFCMARNFRSRYIHIISCPLSCSKT